MNRQPIKITYMSGAQDGLRREFPAPEGSENLILSIGRSEDCDIIIRQDGQVSRNHAQLTCVYNEETVVEGSDEMLRVNFMLEDLNSRNGTYVGEYRFRGETVELNPGDMFRVGRTWIMIDQ